MHLTLPQRLPLRQSEKSIGPTGNDALPSALAPAGSERCCPRGPHELWEPQGTLLGATSLPTPESPSQQSVTGGCLPLLVLVNIARRWLWGGKRDTGRKTSGDSDDILKQVKEVLRQLQGSQQAWLGDFRIEQNHSRAGGHPPWAPIISLPDC